MRAAIRRELRALALTLYSRRAPGDPLFVITPMPRSGSTLLVSYLNSLPGVTIAGEPLNHQTSIGIRRRLVTKSQVIRHLAGTIGHLDGIVRGAKLVGGQLETRGITINDLTARFPRSRLILIYRESILNQFVSLAVARATREWSGRKEFDGRITISLRDFDTFLDDHRRRHQQALSAEALVISYEQLVAAPQAVFAERICPYIGISYSTVSTPLEKRIRRPISEVVTNWDEISHLADLKVSD